MIFGLQLGMNVLSQKGLFGDKVSLGWYFSGIFCMVSDD